MRHPTVFFSLLTGLTLLATPCLAKSEVNTTFWGNVAIKGYDPVAYFTMDKPVKGAKQHSLEWRGATWRFASEAHLKKFRSNPEKYAPQYGGYCAWAVSQGDTADIDPKQWHVVNDRLYLNYNASIQKKWLRNRDELIRKADGNWPGVIK